MRKTQNPNLRIWPRTATAPVLAAVAVLTLVCALLGAFTISPANAAGGCGTQANPIACENALPGTSPTVWDNFDGSGDSSIQGFATDISVNVGSSIGFKVDTPAKAYTIQIFRTGYYQGLGARKIADVTPSATLPQVQPQCKTDAATELYDCGNWGVSASWTVPTDAVSGVYVALLTRNDTHGQSQIIFVVRNNASHSAIVFQTSDPTWEAYNPYGGSDFYQGGDNGRAYKISYNRPFATRDGTTQRDFYFSSEFAMVQFMERNGYDVTYQAGVDTDRYGSLLTNHKVFMSVGHDEYWSAGQRANVIAARDAGVNLLFASGNEMYWHTRYEPSTANGSSTSYRTLTSYKETWSNAKIDPTAEWTGTYRDPRFASQANGAGIPENGVTGTMYMSTVTDLPVTVSSAEGKTRLWRSTNLTNLTSGSTAALAQHTVGYESDEDLDNGFRPSGLIRLSTVTGAVSQEMLDFGSTVGPGTTTNHITMYRAPSGALVYSVGSIQWAWGLTQNHDGDGAPADSRMQQAQINMFADMGVKATTLMSGMVQTSASADTTAPTTTITSPAAGASIPNGQSVTVTGTASDIGGVVAGVEVSTDGSTWHPATGTTNWTYTYVQNGTGTQTIRVRGIDDSGNYTSAPSSRSVTVTGPYSIFGSQVPTTADSGDGAAYELGLKFTATQNGYISGVRFFKSAANTGAHTGSLWTTTGTRLATVNFSGESASGWQTASFVSVVAVTAGTSYIVSYTDPAGHYAVQNYAFAYRGLAADPMRVDGGFGAPTAGFYGQPGSFPDTTSGNANYYVDAVFTTVDNTPLQATSQWPLPGSSSNATSSTIGAVFSKDVTPSTIAFTVTSAAGTAVDGTVSYAASTRTATFTPSAALASATTYSVTLTAKDTNGIALSSGGTWSFITSQGSPGASCPCGLFDDSTAPTVQEFSDSPVSLGLSFSSTSAGTVTGMRFYKSSGNTGAHVGTLWAADGTKLATGTFQNETTAGWQTLNFTSPVNITANTKYAVSYRTTTGKYSVTPGAFTSGMTNGSLVAGANAGVFNYADAFPNSTSSSSYLVDVVFMKAPDPVSVVSQAPASGAISVPANSTISITVSAPVAPGYAFTVKNGSTAIAGTAALSADGKTITFTPSQALPDGATITATVSGVTSTGGGSLPTQSWSFTTAAAAATTYSFFGNATPATPSTNDSSALELGLSFTSSQDGTVSAIRFYKAAGNVGTHTGTLWSSSGTALATVTFANETALGWQTAQLSTPVAITAGQTYVVSYFAPYGHYASSPNYFAQPATSGPLTAAAATNGRFTYGPAGGFPTDSYGATNYFVDVVFTPAATSGSGTGGSGTGGSGTGGSGTGGSGTGGGTTTTGGGSGGTGGTTTTPQPGVSIFPDASIPANTAWQDGRPVQLGVRFTTSVAGTITGIRFYKGTGDTGTHTGSLWSATGTLLATGTFSGESGSGWQDLYFSTPVSVTPGTEYRASYYTTWSAYAVDPGALTNPVSNGPLTTVANGGAYSYSTGFPDQTVTHNYWVDVHFVAAQ
ncbi:DUF4082 domain-containing protein [Leifsonia sp. 2MCAF36]|uniref:DUF4082 domain-containing protein n=1 Tax=Leifsonia sp. 2MCAF36 TaxID=3232988 RepID=UPI003F9ACBAD